MNLANMAPGRAPWIGPEPLAAPAAPFLSFQLSFDLPAPPSEASPAWFALNEPWDYSRHGAELAALLVMLQPAEPDILPLLGEATPPAPEEAPPLPRAPMPPLEPAPWMPPPSASLPPPDWLML